MGTAGKAAMRKRPHYRNKFAFRKAKACLCGARIADTKTKCDDCQAV